MPEAIMPSSFEAERALLGTAVTEPILLDKLIGWIRVPEALYRKDHQRIWKVIMKMHQERKAIDTITVIEEYKEEFGPESIAKDGVASILVEAAGSIPSTTNAESYAKIVWGRFVQRELAKSSKKMERMSYDNTIEAEHRLEAHKKLIAEIEMLQPSRRKSVDIIVNDTMLAITERDNVISYNLKYLDKPAGGMTRKEITILGGRTGHGKTTMVLNVTRALIEQGYNVVLLNREMTNTEFMKKLFVLESNCLSYNDVRMNQFTEKQAKELLEIKEMVKRKYKEKLTMFDDIRDLGTGLREIRRIGPDVVIDDFIQLIGVRGKFDARRFEIETIMHEYHWLAKECNLSVFLSSQLSREIEKRLDPTPRMSDYSEGGTIENLAETCLFVFYPYNLDPQGNDEYTTQIVTAKARYGKVDNFEIGFRGNRCKFYEKPEQARRDIVNVN